MGGADAHPRLAARTPARSARAVAPEPQDRGSHHPDLALRHVRVVGQRPAQPVQRPPTGRSSAASIPTRWRARPRDVWAEIWGPIGPRTDAVMQRGEATFDEAPAADHGSPRLRRRDLLHVSPTARCPTTTGRSAACSAPSPKRPSASSGGAPAASAARAGRAHWPTPAPWPRLWRRDHRDLRHGHARPAVRGHLFARRQRAGGEPWCCAPVWRDDHPACPSRPRARARARSAPRAANARSIRARRFVIDDSSRRRSANSSRRCGDRAPTQVVVSPITQAGPDAPRRHHGRRPETPIACSTRTIAASSAC